MKKFIAFTIILSLAPMILEAQCPGGRYRDLIFQNHTVTSDIVYGSNINNLGQEEELKMDIYTPEGDNETSRPLVILCHGGYFLAGDKAGADMVPMAEDLSKMGYVVASINYRMGIPFSLELEVPYGQAVVRSVQDLRAAIRWFRKDAAEGGNQYNIDPEQIYTGGSSAGGFMALHLAYMDESEIPEWLDTTIPGLGGGLEGESGNPGYSSEVNAIFSVSGALGDNDWVDAEDTTPACLFHGDADNTVTIDSGMFVLFNIIEVTNLEGSNKIAEKLVEYDIEHCYEINEGMGHVAYTNDAAIYDTTLSIISNFLSHYICDIPLDCSYREILISTENIEQEAINIYPVPASERCFISQQKKQYRTVDIYNIHGHLLSVQTLNSSGEIDLRSLPSGMYILGLTDGHDRDYTRLIVE